MAKQALIEQRPWLLASIAAATAFYFLSDNPVFEGTWGLLAKGASVGLLAIYVWLRVPHDRRGRDGVLLTLALALAAAGDVAIELYFTIGGAFFAAAHGVAVALYLTNPRKRHSPSQRMLSLALLVGTPLISYLLSGLVEIAIYAVFLGAMAASAWYSRFPRYRVGTGAVLFVVSDWLIFARLGSYDLGMVPDLLIWPLYYAGQVMIATGIVQCLRGEQPVR
ncbi:lysoplasmalogenase family protein [Erythrobacter dokdonensis]|uniref:YhhN-like protein n=1 Tax=Erythrobacter dokdonensis DSW-74 TaxID=1300349 RepID=A0A1A7BLG1_9SPHN|nr:lysoplasmalogenase family protein [Erythrobacter dokdonensis]OBV12566.1 YhhN-like protein [Erythrobacter dokdonensis DSW-74]